MPYKIDYTKVKGIYVYLELRSTREFVGHLGHNKNGYVFTYDKKYLEYKKAIPLGPELPLTKVYFESEDMFASFQDRIPSKENPAYPEYCAHFGIRPNEGNYFTLLATVGSKGPSSFVFEPEWQDAFSAKDLKNFRKKFTLSTRDFATCFNISHATVVRIENGKASGSEVLKFIEIMQQFPEAAEYWIKKYAHKLHSKVKERTIRALDKSIYSKE